MRNSMVPGQSTQSIVPSDGSPPGIEHYAEPAVQNPASNNLGRIISALRRFRWLIAACLLVGVAGGIVATKFVQPDYEVSARIWIETPTQGRAGTPIQGEELLDSRAWLELLTTFKVLDPVVESRKLYLTH